MTKRRAEQALSDYLERLLQPDPDAPLRPLAEPEPEPVPAVLLPASRSRLQQLLDQVSDAPLQLPVVPASAPASVTVSPAPHRVEPVVAPVAIPVSTAPAEKNAPSAVSPAPAPEVLTVPVSAVAEAVAQAGSIRYTNDHYRKDLPASFPTLVFRIDDLKLALPLHLLGGIQRRDKPLTPLVGRADWFLGLMPHEPENLNVVDTGRYLLADKYRPELVDGYRYVIRIGDTAWGLACTDLCTTRNLSQDDVRWYDSNPRRPWLAGMIKEDRCALLNPEALVEALAQRGRRAA